MNDTPVACQIREPTDPQGDRCPRRGRMRCRRTAAQAHYLSPTGIVSRPGASVSFVSDGPISSNSGRNGGKNAGRNCVSALPQRAIPGSDLLRILADIAFHHRCQSKGLCLRSPARRLARPLAPATVGVFRSYRPLQAFPLMRSQGDGCPGRTSPSLPLEGSAALNDTPPSAFPLRGSRR